MILTKCARDKSLRIMAFEATPVDLNLSYKCPYESVGFQSLVCIEFIYCRKLGRIVYSSLLLNEGLMGRVTCTSVSKRCGKCEAIGEAS